MTCFVAFTMHFERVIYISRVLTFHRCFMTRFKDKTRDNIYFPAIDEKQNKLFAFLVSTISLEDYKNTKTWLSRESVVSSVVYFCSFMTFSSFITFAELFKPTWPHSLISSASKKSENPNSSDVNNMKSLRLKKPNFVMDTLYRVQVRCNYEPLIN